MRILLIAHAPLPNAAALPLRATVCGETVAQRGRHTLLLDPSPLGLHAIQSFIPRKGR